eukprot:13291-Heterococcus_DN1.PRE.3
MQELTKSAVVPPMSMRHDAAESTALKRAIDVLHEQQVYLRPRLEFDDLFRRECIDRLQQGLERRRCKENTGFNFGTIVYGEAGTGKTTVPKAALQ